VVAPSGEQIELSHGDQRAVVVEVGGGLRSYSVGGRDVLDAYRPDEMCSSGRGQVLAPWPNRLSNGTYEFDGRTHQLPLTEPEAGNAIHGLVRWVVWRVAEREQHRVVVEHALHPQPGYPFALTLRIEYVLADPGLRVTTTATNVGAERCPFGTGAHPYVSLGTETVDPLFLQVPARTVLESDEHGIPTGTRPVEGSEFDFRQARAIGRTVLDHGFTDLGRDDDGIARVVLEDPDAGDQLTLWLDERYRYLMLYTGDARPDVARRSLAVEPMTCPPNAFSTGDDVIVLEPGESVSADWGIVPPGG